MAPGAIDGAGLGSVEAAERLRTDGRNELTQHRPHTLRRQLLAIVTEPMLLLVLSGGIVNFFLAEPLDGAVLLSTMVMIIGVTLRQERKTASALDALRSMSDPLVSVLRDGTYRRIAAAGLVRGDLITVSEGDRVPADAVLVSGSNVSVDESVLTGESLAVAKLPADPAVPADADPGAAAANWLWSGTLVVRGRATAVVRLTGDRSALGRIGRSLEDIETPRTPLQREVNRIVRVIAVIGGTGAIFVAAAYTLWRGSALEGVLAGIATAMSVLPEEFPVVLTVFLALGTWRLSRERVLARRPEVIETLGSVTVMCVDKTGTLTMNEMTVSHLWSGNGWETVGPGAVEDHLRGLVEFAVLASPIDPFDPMDRAFRMLAAHGLGGTENVHGDWSIVREYPLSAELMALSHVWRSPDRSGFVVATKGAPESVASLCHLDDGRLSAVTAAVSQMTGTGHRVLAVACARVGAGEDLPAVAHDFDFEFLGLAALVDPVRPGVPEAVRRCAQAGVRTVMITGDHAGTASAVAGLVHLEGHGFVLTGPEMSAMSDPELAGAVRSVNVYARMTPDQKLRLVTALQADGETVGMTGDGVNDAPALRKADVGIAMGMRGTDVARDASAMVITDDDFGSIVRGIERGRGIFDNIRKAMCYVMAVHIPVIGMAIVPLLVDSWPLVMMPVQIAFLELIIDPTCSLVFESEDVDPGVMNRPPRRRDAPMFDRHVLVMTVLQGLSVLACVLAVYWTGVQRHDPDDVVRSCTFAALVLSNLALMSVNRSWHLTAWRTFATRRNHAVLWVTTVTLTVLVVLLTVPFLRRAFGFGVLDVSHVALVLCAAVASVSWFEIWKHFRRGK